MTFEKHSFARICGVVHTYLVSVQVGIRTRSNWAILAAEKKRRGTDKIARFEIDCRKTI